MAAPRVFISYSWDGDNQKRWARILAEQLRQYGGINTRIDQWFLHLGDSVTAFMEQEISQADYIIVICTPTYAEKSNARIGGVGYEQQIMSNDLLRKTHPSKILPILRSGEFGGERCAIPVHLGGILAIDFRNDAHFQENMETLVRRIYSKPKFSPPPLGKPPNFEEAQASSDSSQTPIEHLSSQLDIHQAGSAPKPSTTSVEKLFRRILPVILFGLTIASVILALPFMGNMAIYDSPSPHDSLQVSFDDTTQADPRTVQHDTPEQEGALHALSTEAQGAEIARPNSQKPIPTEMPLRSLTYQVEVGQSTSYINQEKYGRFVDDQAVWEGAFEPVLYNYYVLYNQHNNSVLARNSLFWIIGEGDAATGKKRTTLLELLNRRLLHDYTVGDTLIVPTNFELDLLAYSPFPQTYVANYKMGKLLVIDRETQTFAAYQNGSLQRWGIAHTGAPQGRYNLNWKAPHLSSPSQSRQAYWAFSFDEDQERYLAHNPMIIGSFRDYGAVRLIEADAKWIYEWADTWKPHHYGLEPTSIDKQGTLLLIIGELPETPPTLFFHKKYPLQKRIALPRDPFKIAPGTSQQQALDTSKRAAIL